MKQFDTAIRKRDAEASIRVLIEAKLSAVQAEETVASNLKDPEHYGF